MPFRLKELLIFPSVAVLIGANLLPLYGVLFLGWQVFPVIFLFWLENVIIGVFNVLRITFFSSDKPLSWLAKIFMAPFFCFHYGMFCFVHGIFVVGIFGKTFLPQAHFPSLPGIVAGLINTENGFGLSVLAITLSHGFSFLYNYLGTGEFKRTTFDDLMRQPYARVAVLHITLLLGTFLVIVLKTTVVGLLLLIMLKIGIDIKAHLKEHRIVRQLT